MLDMYMDFKIFELFRDKATERVNYFNTRDKFDVKDLYKHVFLSPSSIAGVRSFKVQGSQFPYVSLWSTSPLNFNTEYGLYGKSVLPVNVLYTQNGIDIPCRGFFYDYKKTYELSAASYFRDFLSDVNQMIHELDRLRYFDIEMNELLPGYTSRIELKLGDPTFEDDVDEDSGQRQFVLNATYDLSCTLFVPQSGFDYIETLRVYLNSHLIYTSDIEVKE